jgi:hypothetical protein
MRIRIWAFGLLVCGVVQGATPVIHRFEAWQLQSDKGKLAMYIGWTNGFLTAGKPAVTQDLIGAWGQ